MTMASYSAFKVSHDSYSLRHVLSSMSSLKFGLNRTLSRPDFRFPETGEYSR